MISTGCWLSHSAPFQKSICGLSQSSSQTTLEVILTVLVTGLQITDSVCWWMFNICREYSGSSDPGFVYGTSSKPAKVWSMLCPEKNWCPVCYAVTLLSHLQVLQWNNINQAYAEALFSSDRIRLLSLNHIKYNYARTVLNVLSLTVENFIRNIIKTDWIINL